VETASRCHLFAGHNGPHEEVDTEDELTWGVAPRARVRAGADSGEVVRTYRKNGEPWADVWTGRYTRALPVAHLEPITPKDSEAGDG
jgi:hypothetical protein